MRALPSTSRVRRRARISETENYEETDAGDANRDPGADTEVVATRMRFGNLGGEDDESGENDSETDTDEQRNNDETDTDELNRNPTGAIGIRSPEDDWWLAKLVRFASRARGPLYEYRRSVARIKHDLSQLIGEWPTGALIFISRTPVLQTCVFFQIWRHPRSDHPSHHLD